MARAFLLIQTEIEVAKAAEVVEKLSELVPEVKAADRVTGPYDVIAEVEAETVEEIGSMVRDRLHFVPGVYRVVTCLVIERGYSQCRDGRQK